MHFGILPLAKFVGIKYILVENKNVKFSSCIVDHVIIEPLLFQATACKSYLYSLELKGQQWTMERSLQVSEMDIVFYS